MPISNILICTTQVPFTTGGAEAHVAGLRRAFIDHGYNAEIVALPFKWYPPQEILRSALAWRLLDLTEANGRRIDLVVGMKFPAYTVAHENKVLWIMHQHRAAYNLAGTPFDDLSQHPEGASVRDLIRRSDERFIPEARKVFANSKTVAARLLRYNRIESEPLYHPPPRAHHLHAGETGDYVFYPSRLEPQKRQELLIEALSHTTSPVRVVLAGTTSDRAYYESLIKRHGVTGRVELRGFASEEEMIELYANALAVCYLPFDEDYGYVTLEAMLAERAVIVARDSGGPTEFVEDNHDGFIVEPDARAIADRLDKLFQDRALARQMGARGRAKIEAMNLSWATVVERIISAALF
ncbi:MAG TPA: glycosyltransferase family 4 protein [Pyrinomonadaceae bacterium]|nr:glycosyltransferase family 4 protein [Pyrinomonadaceae bacterium]